MLDVAVTSAGSYPTASAALPITSSPADASWATTRDPPAARATPPAPASVTRSRRFMLMAQLLIHGDPASPNAPLSLRRALIITHGAECDTRTAPIPGVWT